MRKAANLCLNRAELKSYLGGYMTEATGVYEADSPWHGKPTFQIKYDPDAARQLMTEAGYNASKPLHVTVATSASGSGADAALADERVYPAEPEEPLLQCGYQSGGMEHPVYQLAPGRPGPSAKGIDAINVSAAVNDPYFGLIRFSTAKAFRRWRPTGVTFPRRRRRSWPPPSSTPLPRRR
ncbi:hypothetical protein LN650_23960 [Klebsiella pneumoniae subsp. pneumoniae]|nr:hypothetical protein [Klebsiella pneumoniae subsp. pneumoniae]